MPCPGRASAGTVRSASTLDSNGGSSDESLILVNVKPRKERDVARQISGISGVKTTNACWGVPDVFVIAEVANAEELSELVTDKIQLLDGVERTATHIAVE